jgi:DegT/DnrJ/EryC1/StrS aminotransferase family
MAEASRLDSKWSIKFLLGCSAKDYLVSLNPDIEMSLESALCQEFIAKVLTSSATSYFVSGTSAFSYLLERADIPREGTVLLPAFTCEKLLLPLFAGHRPFRLVDNNPNWVTPELEQYQAAYTKDAAAIVLIYVWGYAPRGLEAIVEWARSKRLLIIEDVASAFGLSKDGRPFGSLGDCLFGSFGYDKTWELGGGGFCSGPNLGGDKSARGIGRVTDRYNPLIKLGRRIRLFPVRQRLLKAIGLSSNGILAPSQQISQMIGDAIPHIRRSFVDPMNSRLANTNKFLAAGAGFVGDQKSAFSFVVPNNDQGIGVRLLAELQDRNSALRMLRRAKIWVGTDYAYPLDHWALPGTTPNAQRLGRHILSFITNERNQSVDPCIDLLNEWSQGEQRQA